MNYLRWTRVFCALESLFSLLFVLSLSRMHGVAYVWSGKHLRTIFLMSGVSLMMPWNAQNAGRSKSTAKICSRHAFFQNVSATITEKRTERVLLSDRTFNFLFSRDLLNTLWFFPQFGPVKCLSKMLSNVMLLSQNYCEDVPKWWSLKILTIWTFLVKCAHIIKFLPIFWKKAIFDKIW